jgi:LacI family transcriptional regulator
MSRRARGPTIKEVARAARVDPAVISRVANGDVTLAIRPETRARVTAAIERLGYRADAVARGLRTGAVGNLGFLYADFANPLYPPIIRGAEEAAAAQGFGLLIAHVVDSASVDKRYLALIRERRVDGLLLCTSGVPDRVIEELLRLEVPFMLVNQQSERTHRYAIVDDAAGSATAVGHLAELGHRSIGYLAGRSDVDAGRRRLAGYRDAVKRLDLDRATGLVEECGFGLADGRSGVKRLLTRFPALGAIFANNAPVAAGALSALRETGMRVPEDISVIALHDFPYASCIAPPLTTVEMPLSEMGARAAHGLAALIRHRTEPEPCILPPGEVIMRSSTRASRG